jgi:hypothetical protein
MATPSLSPSYTIAMLARQAAIKAVKADLWARGAKLSYISPREIRVIADEYLVAHRAELVAQATEKWRAMTERNPKCTNSEQAKIKNFDGAYMRCKMTTIGYARAFQLTAKP